jgi:hypothetical protein
MSAMIAGPTITPAVGRQACAAGGERRGEQGAGRAVEQRRQPASVA